MTMKSVRTVGLACVGLWALPALAATVEIQRPLHRVAYQTNERIDLAIVRAAAEGLAAETLTVTLASDDGSGAVLRFPAPAATAVGTNGARRTEHVYLNGRLLRPGVYTVVAAVDGTSATNTFEVHTHLRKSPFRLIDWGCATRGPLSEALGQNGAGFNLLYASLGGHDQDANIRGGLDYMRNDALGGGHQMDMRQECDWSDPYVLAGGGARASRQVFRDRTAPNVIGVHFYDEPGLTWSKHPKTGEFTGHGIPAQERAFRAAFDREPPFYKDIRMDDPASVAAWNEWSRWKLGFMDAAWKYTAFAMRYAKADYIPTTQSAYGWHAFGDGYYFNVVRSLPVISGHGGYDDYAGGYVNPGIYAEFGRMRDLGKPFWYLPTWWAKTPPTRFRLEQYLSFMINLQGLASPPTMSYADPKSSMPTLPAVVESNHLMARLGTIFTTMPVTRPPAAMLYSMSQNIRQQIRNMGVFQDFEEQLDRLQVLMFASKRAGIPLMPIVEEDILDGTLAANHRALFLTGVETLDPEVVRALEAFAAGGGTVVLGDECTVAIKGARKLGARIDNTVYIAAGKKFEEGRIQKVGVKLGLYARRPNAYFEAAKPVAKALIARCREAGIEPVVQRDNPWVFVNRQAQGDVEYLFLVNAEQDVPGADMNSIKAAEAEVSLPNDGRPIYDAIHARLDPAWKADGKTVSAALRFGPGQMRVYARTRAAISGVQVATPGVYSDYTAEAAPLGVRFVTAVLAADHRVLAGPVPLRVQLFDPLGIARYDLYRVAPNGQVELDLPLAVNDPQGVWTARVQELLGGHQGEAAFTWRPPTSAGALAGTPRRAVFFGDDPENVYRFFQLHRDVTLVIGSNAFARTQAERLAKILEPWDVRCQIVSATNAVKLRPLTQDQQRTWTGRTTRSDTGFDVRGPVILLGNPQDNALIKSLHATFSGPKNKLVREAGYLPFDVNPLDFPGSGRGLIAWQVNGVGFYNQESIALIAYDEAGLSEAVGTVFEWASGLDALTRYHLPQEASVTAASRPVGRLPEPEVAWSALLPDRAVRLTTADGSLQALSADGTLTVLGAEGRITKQKVTDAAEAQGLIDNATFVPTTVATPKPPATPGKPPAPAAPSPFEQRGRVIKTVAVGEGLTAVAYWGGLVRLFDANQAPVMERKMPQDVAVLAWSGDLVIAALADGEVVALKVK